MTKPLISVITICRNSEALVGATARSVLSQSYPRLEYVIVDGLSVDRTVDVVREVAARHPGRTVKLISESDTGISDAMNKGVLLSSGELVTHLHSGDRYVDELALEKVMTSYITDKWRWGVASSILVDPRVGPCMALEPSADNKNLRNRVLTIPHQSTFLVRDIFDRHGLFRTDYKQAMDYEYWLRIAFKGGERPVILPFVTTYYLAGGVSSRRGEVALYLWKLRRLMREYGCQWSPLEQLAFFAKILVLYRLYFGLKLRTKLLFAHKPR